MPDISMCRNVSCPLKEKCYRYMALPGIWQSYATFKYDDGCDRFWPIRKGDLLRRYITPEETPVVPEEETRTDSQSQDSVLQE